MNGATDNDSKDERDSAASILLGALAKMAIVSANQQIALTPMTGGVSSDIYRADLPSRVICVKRALPKLKVAADWRAPVGRSRYEVEWMRVAGGIVPSAVPEILGEDRESGAFAMAYLAPDTYPLWKAQLRDGTIDLGVAAAVGDVLGRIHAATAGPSGDCRALSHRRHLLRDSPRALPRRDRARASGPRRAPPGAGRDDAHEPARAGPRRLQPEEPARRPRGPGDPRRRMRVVRRPGVRRRVRPQPSAAEGRVAAAVATRGTPKHSKRWSPRTSRTCAGSRATRSPGGRPPCCRR